MVYEYIPSESSHKWTCHTADVPAVGSRHRLHADCGPIEERVITGLRAGINGIGKAVTVIEYRTEIFTSDRWVNEVRRSRPDATVIVR